MKISLAKYLGNYGLHFKKEVKHDQALKCFNAAIVLDEKDKYAWFYKGCCESELNEKQKAVQSYKQCIILDPINKYAWSYQGIILYQLGKQQEAIDCFAKCIQLDDKYYLAWQTLRSIGMLQQLHSIVQQLLSRMKWKRRCVVQFRAILKSIQGVNIIIMIRKDRKGIQPRALYYFNQGLALEKLNHEKEAIQSIDLIHFQFLFNVKFQLFYYKEALKLNPQRKDAEKRLQALESKQSQPKEEQKVIQF